MKILYGICGIGNGHTFRQLPILCKLLEQGATVLVFAYDASFIYFQNLAKQFPNLHLARVAVPYYVGKVTGLDFERSKEMDVNDQNFFSINCEAMAVAEKILGKPDLVISDYEPISAQYAYMWDVDLITIDQQSKFLTGDFLESLDGCFYKDEVMRLRMFFPKAALRIATSFFSVDSDCGVHVTSPILREEIYSLDRTLKKDQILVYLSAQQFDNQPLEEFLNLFSAFKNIQFHLFTPNKVQHHPLNVHSYAYSDKAFNLALKNCSAIISTAGHSLLSEAMFLNIPVLAIPLPLYEQQMNAHVIHEHKFGMKCKVLDVNSLEVFIDGIDMFRENILKDRTVLLRENGFSEVFKSVERKLPSFSTLAEK